jgi:hypothetical protein
MNHTRLSLMGQSVRKLKRGRFGVIANVTANVAAIRVCHGLDSTTAAIGWAALRVPLSQETPAIARMVVRSDSPWLAMAASTTMGNDPVGTG